MREAARPVCWAISDVHGPQFDIELCFKVNLAPATCARGHSMQTILGANGQIATELARELRRSHTDGIRLVSRTPRKVNDTDTLVSANLLDARQTAQAVQGSRVVYFTAGLPPDTALWKRSSPRC
jgi:glutamyl-tRNA reductase